MAVASVLGITVTAIALLGSVFGVFQQFSSLQADNKSLEKQIKQVDDKLGSFIAEVQAERKETNQLRVDVAGFRGQVSVLMKH